jgi:hypothetical protein
MSLDPPDFYGIIAFVAERVEREKPQEFLHDL